ncbi:hypothetical protein BOTNAR_0296g00020 [Botryotinia narcissicola]|uniref:O-methyltransferase domain-containing protein n=1 Tax=Botryotinia narcissicola TaxID=278944 RepID=A0A4Z1HVY9_9HELO|nr:hypothetical protein BOTNAR_0296g00020 [Botryotinia narcissicola]
MVKLNMLHRLPTFGGEASRLAENAGEATHQQLIDQLREFTYSLELNDNTTQRIIYCQLEIVVVRVGEELKIIKLLASWGTYLTVKKLSKETNAEPVLLSCILRYLASMKLIKETGKDCWSARHPGEWMLQYMQGQKTRLNTFFLEKEVGGWKPTSGKDVPLVDVGGTAVRHLDELKAKTAGIEGRVILQELPKDNTLRSGQDQPHDTNAAAENPAVENTVYDIDTPQSVKDAKFYYIRSVFHNSHDEKCCRSILSNIGPAMGKNQFSEEIFSDFNVSW